MLDISSLCVRYGDLLVLDRVGLTVAPGQILGLVGPNGAGKSTLISAVAGLVRPESGRIRVAGLDAIRHRRAALAHIGLAPQELGIYPTLSVAENLSASAGLAGLGGPSRRRAVAETIETLSLGAVAGRRAGELSGGQKRRLHTGMAIVGGPDLLFLDEPTVGADVESRLGILESVRMLAARGSAVVYTSHYLPECEELGADIAVLAGGRIVESGPVADLVGRWAETRIVLDFSAPVFAPDGWTQDGSGRLSRPCQGDQAGALVAGALGAVGSDAAGRLAGVEVFAPSLENAYLAITARYASREEAADALAAA